MLIRPVTLDDVEALRASTCAGMTHQQTADLLRADWLQDGRGVFLVAVEDAAIVGSVTVQRLEHRMRRHRASLGGFVIVERARGTGLARKMVEACADWAAGHGCSILELEVRGGTQAENAYHGLGFVEYGRLPGGLVEPAGTFDQVEMYLPIADLRRRQ